MLHGHFICFISLLIFKRLGAVFYLWVGKISADDIMQHLSFIGMDLLNLRKEMPYIVAF